MGGLGGSYNESESNFKSNQGLRGTKYEDNAAQQSNDQGMLLSKLSNKLTSSPGAMMSMGKKMMPGGKYGLGENADQGVEALGDYQFGKASGNSATRGQVNPENMSAVIGSSMQNMLPFLIPQLQQQQYQQFQAPQSLMQTAKTSADYWNRALGAQSDASSSSFGFGMNAQVGGSLPGLAPPSGSDRSIKYMVSRVGTHALNIGLYLFRYLPKYWERYGSGLYIGVMADEVLQVCPQAVGRHPEGYMTVDYGKLK